MSYFHFLRPLCWLLLPKNNNMLTLLTQTTINLKKVELPVKQIVSGRIIKPSGTLANPQSLDYYYQFAKVEELVGPKEKL